MSKLMQQIAKFGVVGILAFAIDYGLMIALVEVGGRNYLIASMISFCASVVFNYLCSILWVFNVRRKGKWFNKFIIFLILSVIGLGLNQVLMLFQVEVLELYYWMAKLFSTAIIMVYNFITRKKYLERV